MPPRIQEILTKQRENPETANAGLPWKESDDEILLTRVKNDTIFDDVAKELHRTVGSIKTRLITHALNRLASGDEQLDEISADLRLESNEITEYKRKKEIRDEKRKQKNPPNKPNRGGGGYTSQTYTKKVTLEEVYSLLLEVKTNIDQLVSGQ